MARTAAQQRARYKYNATHIKRISLKKKKKYYDTVLKPAADRAGESVNGYIKKAIADRIKKDSTQKHSDTC